MTDHTLYTMKGLLWFRRVFIFLCAFTLLFVAVMLLNPCLYVVHPTEMDSCTEASWTFLLFNPFTGEEPPACCVNCNIREPSTATLQWAYNISLRRRPYIFFMEITEQLSANTMKFFQLAYFSTLWNFNMVEPWIYNNSEHLSSLPSAGQPHSLLFFDLYNKTAIQNMLTKCYNSNLPQYRQTEFVFHTMSEAMMYSPREILLVRFIADKSAKWTKGKHMRCCICDNISGSVSKRALKALSTHVQEFETKNIERRSQTADFRIWKTLCISAIPGYPFSIKNATIFIKKHLEEKQNQSNPDVSVVIESWRSVAQVRTASYYVDPTFTFDTYHCPYRNLPHNTIVFSAVDRMQKALNLSAPFIAIYARTERLAREDLKKGGTMEGCFQNLLVVLNNSKAMYGIPQSRVVLVHDAGKYGSNTFNYQKGARKRSSTFLKRFPLFNISIVHYDPNENKDLPQHRAFVAAVEQEFLSRGHVLITMGGGGFAINVWGRFKAR